MILSLRNSVLIILEQSCWLPIWLMLIVMWHLGTASICLFRGDKYEEKQMMKFWSLYESDADFLHIDFRIMFFDSSFHTIYKNKPSLSLILFKTAYAVGDNTKACRGVGTNATRARKMKKNILTQEYRRLYLRLKVEIKRHPKNGYTMNCR